MTIIKNLDEILRPLKNPVLTIGNFDGVHRGHLALFNKVKERAVDINGKSAVMTFEPHPIRVIKPGNGPPLITPTGQKLSLISHAGIDVIFCIPFDHEFAARTAYDFVEQILVNKIGIRELIVGYDYTFGYQRKGNIELLRELGEKFGFKVHVLEPIYIDNKLVSSTSVRNLVQGGNLEDAKLLLGRDYQVCGTVVSGANRGGRLLGFPTANLKLVDELIPKQGVYAVTVILDEDLLYGVTNIGYNPTFGNNILSIETHLLDFSGDLLGKMIKINFIKRLRDEKAFTSIEELSNWIGRDVQQAKELFGLDKTAQSLG